MKNRSGPFTWEVTPSEGIAVQKELAGLVIEEWDGRETALIAGVDVHFPERDVAKASIAIVSFPALELIESTSCTSTCTTPYIPGLLSFREIPPLLDAWEKIDSAPDIVMCDSHGIAHPRRFGMASHLGIVLGIPTIGCAKSHLFGRYVMPGEKKGSTSPVIDRKGETIGTVLRSRNGTRPLYVSIGHMIDLSTATAIVLQCCPKYRIPIPLGHAHRIASVR